MEGKLAVISGFSGAGKGTVIRNLMEEHDGYVLSVSMTTRQPRDNERDGVNYHFVTNEAFEALIEADGFLEHAGYADHYYGTPKAFVEENLRAGRTVLLEIEVQGAMQIAAQYPDAVLVFLTPPDAWELERRLVGRGTEKPEVIARRMQRAQEEVKSIPAYPYLLMNDDAGACARSLHRILTGAWTPEDAGEAGRVITDPEEKEAFSHAFLEGLGEVLAPAGALLP